MPRKQVYGKRSRATHDPFAIFAASPEKPSSKANTEIVKVIEVSEELSRLQVQDARSPDNERVALGQKNANVVVQSPVISRKGHRRRPRSGRLITEEDEREFDGGCRTEECEAVVRAMGEDQENQAPEVGPEPEHTPEIPETHEEQYNEEENHRHNEELDEREEKVAKAIGDLQIESDPLPAPDAYSDHCEQLLQSSAHGLEDFSAWAGELATHFDLIKIAEASFGEVYRLCLSSHISSLSFSRADESVLKIIALKPPESKLPKDKRKRNAALKKAEAMSAPSDVASEVRLLQRMSSIPGFTNFRDVRILKGRPPPPFVKAFKEYNTNQKNAGKEGSIFPDPSKKTSYTDDQLWAVIEMQDAGTDLERLVEDGNCSNIFSVWDVFWQVVLTLAKGEEGAQFEHRDLHLGNICVRSNAPSPTPTTTSTDYSSLDLNRRLNFTSLETTLIDYTISRATMTPHSTSTSSSPEHPIAYTDLSLQPELFEGDSTEEYQYEIYRHMRSQLFLSSPLADWDTSWRKIKRNVAKKGTSWRDFCPGTNVVWLHFVLFKLLEGVEWPSSLFGGVKGGRKKGGEGFRRALELEGVLGRVQELLDPGVEGGLGGASGLVGVALVEGWLGVEDVVGQYGGEGGNEDEDAELEEALEGLQVEEEKAEGYDGDEADVPKRKRTRNRA
ncbi:hypothetical protein MBLNU230_g3093t1 [Neophaeotheca triangularis]